MEPFADVPQISPEEAYELFENGAVLIDVREGHEWNEARIPVAEWLPMSTISEWYGDLPSDRTIVVYCRTGARSAAVVRALMEQAGMENVVNMAGGVIAWEEGGLPLDSGTSPTL